MRWKKNESVSLDRIGANLDFVDHEIGACSYQGDCSKGNSSGKIINDPIK